eukprot:TRINITY_DN1445_c0_g1_i1.p1 TRINITY_DN1445_c0_g1~~TRINITY_DN1445_c0_g1_i1.p1  ORF type:complete len:886 (-),score=199.72 TRINITY_DN1445_c0_g1_i1:45-2429(-)
MSAIQIKTSSLILDFFDSKTPESSCSNPQTNHDQSGGSRVPQYPNGYSAVDQGDCCHTCDTTSLCTAWVFAPGSRKPDINCWLMAGDTEGVPAQDRNYGRNTAFCGGSLTIQFPSPDGQSTMLWRPSTADSANLNGTIEAADCYSTPDDCYNQYLNNMGPGLLSRAGWHLLDDTATPRLEATGDVPWYQNTFVDKQDWYFFAYGNDYRSQLKAYTQIAGRMTVPPLSAFGVWWSRYFPYSETQFVQEVLQGYEDHQLPLNHVVLDMDWHIEPHQSGCNDWGGFTWNQTLFPDPVEFVNWLHSDNNTLQHPLKLLLNVHPQSGVDHCQANYAEFATAMGVNPASLQTVACDMGNQSFVDELYAVYYNGKMLEAVDYWWTDYGGSGGPDAYQLWWSNYIYDQMISAAGTRRPLVLSRYGGLGNHRYPIGFSGDTFQAFITLQWEVAMTPTAANVLFGYWSHDIGGFHDGKDCPGDHDPKNLTGSELLMRWVQFGAVAPILRTHCDHCERRIWEFPYFTQMKDAMLLRNALMPYIYTHARLAYDSGVALVYPMYYDSPQDPNAYAFNEQYMFGANIIAAPITSPVDAQTQQAQKSVWLGADAQWWNWNGTRLYEGRTVVSAGYTRDEIPLFARAGSVTPLRTMASSALTYSDPLMWLIFANDDGGADASGSSNGFSYGLLIEDDGETTAYQNGQAAVTTMLASWGDQWSFVISATEGSSGYSLPITQRQHVLQLRGLSMRQVQSVTANGLEVPQGRQVPGWFVAQADEQSLTVAAGAVVIQLAPTGVDEEVAVKVVC